MAEPGATKPAIQHKGSFRRREARRKPCGAGSRASAEGGRPPAGPPVTLRHADGTRCPAKSPSVWQNGASQGVKGTRPPRHPNGQWVTISNH